MKTMYQVDINYPECLLKIFQNSIKHGNNLRPSKIYQNWEFGFEKKPSGNPVSHKKVDPHTFLGKAFSFKTHMSMKQFKMIPRTKVDPMHF
jgi:hypothetical protein